MRFAGKIALRVLISIAGFIAIWSAGFQLHNDRLPFIVSCCATVLVVIVAARYSRREHGNRKAILSGTLALPFAVCAVISIQAVLEQTWAPVISWAGLALAAAVMSFAADTFLPVCSSYKKNA